MKLSKRFSLLKKSLGLTLLASCMLAYTSCNNVMSVPTPTMVATSSKTLSAPVFPEHTTDDDGNPISVTYSERYYTVSQGRKRKVSLSWNPVEIANHYQIYAAKNINDTFVMVGETKGPSFEDSVGSGRTYYYKVRAVNVKGEYSDFSPIVKGTSLATPAITDININGSNASVFWYMGNTGIDTYAKNLIYEIHAQTGNEEKVVTIKAWDEDNQRIVESYTFESLAGNSEYTFQVIAYVSSDPSQVESSAKVSQRTLAQHTPVSPQFTASQGEYKNYVNLIITLPPMVQVTLGTGTTALEEDFPVYFEIQRKRSDKSDWNTIEEHLYFTGETTVPTTEQYTKYDEGSMIEYEDNIVAGSTNSITRGVKYDYRIISYIDHNFSAQYGAVVASKESLANTAQGWAAKPPTFKWNNRTPIKEEGTITGVKVGFAASWDSLGKERDYNFAIHQTKDGTDKGFVFNSFVLLENIDEVNKTTASYKVPDNNGTYEYTLYVIPKKYSETDVINKKALALFEIPAGKPVSIDGNQKDPEPHFKAEGGWADHTVLSWDIEGGVDYELSWAQLDPNDDAEEDENKQINKDENGNEIKGTINIKNEDGSYLSSYKHDSLPSGFKYRYTLRANSVYETAYAETLGTPILGFDANSYTSITVKWKQVVAAQEYSVQLGKIGKFGNRLSCAISTDGTISGLTAGSDGKLTDRTPIKDDGSDAGLTAVKCEYDSPTKEFTLTIKKPYGWSDPNLSGTAADFVLTAKSLDNENGGTKAETTDTKQVWTIGPALTDTKSTKDYGTVNATSVTITWKKIAGAKRYAVYRMRPEMTGSDTEGNLVTVPAALDVYDVSEDGTSVTPAGATVTLTDDTFTMTDTYIANGTDNQRHLSLGLPYTYTVLPVLKSDDIDSYINDPTEWKIPEVSNSTSTNETYCANQHSLKCAVGYTKGFGLALEATKAEYPNTVRLTWELPQSALDKKTNPTIYYRVKGSDSSWTKIETITTIVTTNGETTTETPIDPSSFKTVDVVLEPENITYYKDPNENDGDPTDNVAKVTIPGNLSVTALEYAIAYNTTNNTMAKDHLSCATYQSGLKNKKITNKELMSVGYMFSLPPIEPKKQISTNESLTEQVQWRFYDYVEVDENGNPVLPTREIGASDIESYTLALQNLNCSGKWYTLCQYDKDGAVTATLPASAWYDATISPDQTDNTIVTVTPKFQVISTSPYNSSTYHDGLLKVQRDYKHYYRISATRTNSKGTTITARSVDYAYRKITEDERNKCVGLICADAFFQMGIPRATGWKNLQTNELAGKTGKIQIGHRSTNDHAYWGTSGNNYQHTFLRTPGQESVLDSGFFIKITNTEGGSCGGGLTDTHKLKTLPSTDITISHECGLPSYSGTRKVEGKPDDFPYNFGTKYENGDSSFNENFYEYKGLWWEVR